jgi:hypothetical protein
MTMHPLLTTSTSSCSITSPTAMGVNTIPCKTRLLQCRPENLRPHILSQAPGDTLG